MELLHHRFLCICICHNDPFFEHQHRHIIVLDTQYCKVTPFLLPCFEVFTKGLFQVELACLGWGGLCNVEFNKSSHPSSTLPINVGLEPFMFLIQRPLHKKLATTFHIQGPTFDLRGYICLKVFLSKVTPIPHRQAHHSIPHHPLLH